jgi:hypothetical protein
MKRVCQLWMGELALQNVFWNWAVVGGFCINLTSSLIFLFLISIDRTITAFIVGYVLTVPYNIIVTVGVWRSAGRYTGDRRWAELAKVITLVVMALLSAT